MKTVTGRIRYKLSVSSAQWSLFEYADYSSLMSLFRDKDPQRILQRTKDINSKKKTQIKHLIHVCVPVFVSFFASVISTQSITVLKCRTTEVKPMIKC